MRRRQESISRTQFLHVISLLECKKRKFSGEVFRFRQEMQLLSLLDHTNIAHLFESFEDYNSVYLIMELCMGGELFDRLSKNGSFPEHVAAHLIKQMLSAISYCHSKGIVHRDLKPENCFGIFFAARKMPEHRSSTM